MSPTNYRTVSLLTSFSIVFEKVLHIRKTEHFYSNKLLVENQFGFRKGVVTEDAIFKLTNVIIIMQLMVVSFEIWRKLLTLLIMIYYCLESNKS